MSSRNSVDMSDSEEEPFEDEPEESHSVSPTAQPERTPSFRTYRVHPNGPRMMHTPRKSVRRPQQDPILIHFNDPYLAPSSSTASRRSDARRWTWVPMTLNRWREQEGNPFPEVGESSTHTRTYPITGEPPHHTIPLLVARTARHEDRIELLEDNMEELPGPESFEELERDICTLGRDYQELRADHEQLKNGVSGAPDRITQIERRLDNIDEKLEKLFNMMDTMGSYANYILKGNHIPK